MAAHHHHASVEDGALHAEHPVGDPAAEDGGEVDQPAVGADDAGRGGLRQLEAAVGQRVVEVVPQDREHPVEREPLPELDAEKIGQADRMAEHGASGGPAFDLSRSCHGATMPREADSRSPIEWTRSAGKGTARGLTGESWRTAHFDADVHLCGRTRTPTPGEPAHAGAGKVTPTGGRPERFSEGQEWTPYSAYR